MNAVLRLAATGGKPSPALSGPWERVRSGRDFLTPTTPAKSIAALLIDPENVLYDATLWRRWLRQLLARMGVQAAFPDFFLSWDRRFRQEVDLGRREFWEAFHDFLAHAGLSEAQIAEALGAARARKQKFESDVRCLPGVKETLARLAVAGTPLYVLTNSPRRADDVLRDLEKMGLKHLFRGGLTSRDLGHVMPSAPSFHKALDRFQLTAEKTALVAGQAHLLAGARRCGLMAVAYNADAESPGGPVLERFSDLTNLIQPAPRAKLAG